MEVHWSFEAFRDLERIFERIHKENQMSKGTFYTLAWSSSHQAYELHEDQGEEILTLASGSSTWSEWVNQVSSFAFQGKNGSYTARKERKRRGEGRVHFCKGPSPHPRFARPLPGGGR